MTATGAKTPRDGSGREPVAPPPHHPSGARPPRLAVVPRHVAVVMDGNGRWANARGLPRVEGHRAGEATLMDVIAGALEIGVSELSAYAFSTENWKRSPAEVRFIMGFSRKVLRAQRDDLNAWGVRVRWVGRTPRLWASVLKELRAAEDLTAGNSELVLNMCINYGGRAEIADAARRIARDAVDGRLKPGAVTERTVRRYLYSPDMGDVDLFIRTGGEQRTSNFLMWESAYAELYFSDVAWPDFDRRELWRACQAYAERDRPPRPRRPTARARPGRSPERSRTRARRTGRIRLLAGTLPGSAEGPLPVERPGPRGSAHRPDGGRGPHTSGGGYAAGGGTLD